MLEKNEHKLPLFYQQQTENDLLDCKEEDTNSMKEFIICCLLDPKFPGFVRKVERELTGIIANEN